MRNKKLFFGMFFLFLILMSISLISSTYIRTVTSGAQYAMASGLSGYGSTQSLKFDKSMCGAEGQDLLVQIVPFGCIPSVVRSDLLEEQDVQVLCQLGATQINPLIDIQAIDYMTITGEHSNAVRGVGYFPSQAALGTVVSKELELSSPILSNLGYAVITLKKQPNESAMPNYVTGNLTAKIRYDIKSAFGIGDVNFYLPVMSDEEWNEKYSQYSFWQGRGYLRASAVDDNSAQITIYADDSVVTSGAFSREGKTYSKVQYSSFNLNKGALSEDLYLPGFSPCLATLNVRLVDLVNPDTTAKFKVGSDYVEIREGEKFLDNKCTLNTNSIDKQGLYQSVKITCKGDSKTTTNTLSFSPRVKISIDGKEGEYGIGDWLFTTEDGKESVYLGHVDSFGDSEKSEDLFVYLVSIPESKIKLSSSELASVNSHANAFKAAKSGKTSDTIYTRITTALGGLADGQIRLGEQLITGKEFSFISYKNPDTGVVSGAKNFKGKELAIVGFGEGEDKGILAIVDDEYLLVSSTTSGEYKIQESGGSDTGLILKEVKTNDGKISLVLKKGTSIYGTFYPTGEGSTCIAYNSCSELTLSTKSEDFRAPTNNAFFENLLGAKVIPSQTKLILSRAVFEDSSDSSFSSYYENAMGDFQTIDVSFADEQDSENSELTYGEEALYQSILLAQSLNRKKTMLELCSEFDEKYPKSTLYANVFDACKNEYKISNDKLSSVEVTINGVITSISFEGISEPSAENYGIELLVQGPNGESRTLTLEKDKVVNLNEFRDIVSSQTEYVQLKDLTTTTASINYYVAGETTTEKALVSNTKTLELDTPYTPATNGGYTFTLKKINLEKSAKVAITGNTNHEYTNASFGFKVGIEKRSDWLFPLTPEKASKKIEALNSSIKDIQKASDLLSKTVTVMKDACLVTGGWLTFKNLVNSFDGKSIARQKIMRGADGWTEKCTDFVKDKTYSSLDQCFLKNAPQIDSQVNEMYQKIQSQNEVMKSLENAAKNSQGNIEINKVAESLSSGTISDLDSNVQNAINLNREDKVDFTKLNTLLTADRFSKNAYSLEQLKEISLYTEILKTTSNSELKITATERLYNVLSAVEANSKTYEAQETLKTTSGLKSSFVVESPDLKVKVQDIQITTPEIFSSSKYTGYAIKPNTNQIATIIAGTDYVCSIVEKGGEGGYLIVYNKKAGGTIDRTYKIDYNAQTLTLQDTENPLHLYFQIVSADNLVNEYKNPTVKYYEEAPYSGKPAIVPFSTKEGWYAAIKPFVTSESLQAIDDSGVVKVFWVCNVGPDGLEDFFSSSRDDICTMYNLRTGQPLNELGGLSTDKASKVIRAAQEAIYDAQNQHKSGVSKIIISTGMGTETFKVGTPAVEIPEFQCQDFMSPKDCNILFNVCDPVVCPSSRCDMGGNYPVKNVVQSGIIGSIALCLPNAKEGIVIPICVSGVQAGLDGFLSVQESYRDCLQTNIDTGATVGICDEVYSIYMCDFFWKQALPLAKIGIPKALSAIFGQSARGGGEYLGVKDALAKAKESIDYFKSNYAANSWKAFKLRSTEEVGSEVCQNFPSIVTFDVKSLLSDLTEPDSPFQFTGNFQETTLTTATNPALSHYKVFYHIYAGKDTDAYYLVYLRQGTGSSYYQDTVIDRVASGHIKAGGYATNATDFTAPSGYKQLCISVNGQEDCSFEQVSSSFAVDYLSEMYIKEQSTEQVTTEKQCISGTASLYSILNPNVQSIAEELIDPKIYENGIIRTCATENPGKTSDVYWEDSEKARWVSVGYCGETNVKCWLDRDKVKEIVKSLNIKNEIVQETSKNYADTLFKQGNYLTTEQFDSNISEINAKTSSTEKIELINSLFPKVFFNNQKARLFLMRGKIYAQLAKDTYDAIVKEFAETKAAAEIAQQQAAAGKITLTCGKKVYNTAVYYSDGTYDHIRSDGETNNPCASFVSKVLSESGVDAPGIITTSGLCQAIDTLIANSLKNTEYFTEIYTYSDYKAGKSVPLLQEGDVVIFGKNAASYDDNTQHTTIFSKYSDNTKTIAEVVSDPGQDSKVKIGYYAISNRNGWHVSNVYRPIKCSEGSGTSTQTDTGTGVENIFFIKEDKLIGSRYVYFKYEDNDWKWSAGSATNYWMDTSSTDITLGQYKGKTPEKDTQYVITALEGLGSNLFEGGKLIIKNAGGMDINEREIIISSCTDTCASLGFECGAQTVCKKSVNCGTCATAGQTCSNGKCVASSTATPSEVLIFMIEPTFFQRTLLGMKTVYYKYENEWQWSMDEKNWMTTFQKIVIGGEFDGKSASTSTGDILNSLTAIKTDVYKKGLTYLISKNAVNEDGSEIVLASN